MLGLQADADTIFLYPPTLVESLKKCTLERLKIAIIFKYLAWMAAPFIRCAPSTKQILYLNAALALNIFFWPLLRRIIHDTVYKNFRKWISDNLSNVLHVLSQSLGEDNVHLFVSGYLFYGYILPETITDLNSLILEYRVQRLDLRKKARLLDLNIGR